MNLFKKLGLLAATTVATLMLGTVAFADYSQDSAGETYAYVNTDRLGNQSYSYEISTDSNFTIPARYTQYGGSRVYISGLSAGTNYWFRYDTGRGWSKPLEFITVPDFATADKVEQVSAGNGTGTFKWSRCKGATAYRVFVNNVQVATTGALQATVRITNGATIKICPIKKCYSTGFAVANSYGKTFYSAKVLPGKLEKVKQDGASGKTIYLDWTDVTNASGYQLEYANYKGKGKYTVDTGYSSYYYLYNSKAQFYRVRARAYVTCGNRKFYGAWSGYSYVTHEFTASDVTLKDASTRYQRRAKVSWKKMKGAKKYVVYMAQGSAAGFKKIATTKKRSITVSKYKGRNLTNGYYYFKVVAIGKVGKKKIKSYNNRTRYIYFYSTYRYRY